MDSSTPAVLMTHPSCAMLPLSTARPPSFEYACARSRMQPALRSVSRLSQLESWDAILVLNLPDAALR